MQYLFKYTITPIITKCVGYKKGRPVYAKMLGGSTRGYTLSDNYLSQDIAKEEVTKHIRGILSKSGQEFDISLSSANSFEDDCSEHKSDWHP